MSRAPAVEVALEAVEGTGGGGGTGSRGDWTGCANRWVYVGDGYGGIDSYLQTVHRRRWHKWDGFLNCTGAPTGAMCWVPSTSCSAQRRLRCHRQCTTTAHPVVAASVRKSTVAVADGDPRCLALVLAWSATESMSKRWRFASIALMLCACGGGNSPAPTNPTPTGNNTSAGTYIIVVTATSGSTTQSQNLTLVVK